MHIHISSEEKRLHLFFPTALALNRFAARAIAHALTKQHVALSSPPDAAQLRMIIGEIKRCKKRDPNWVLLEVKSASGETIVVKL